jgi:hypothetical protein
MESVDDDIIFVRDSIRYAAIGAIAVCASSQPSLMTLLIRLTVRP